MLKEGSWDESSSALKRIQDGDEFLAARLSKIDCDERGSFEISALVLVDKSSGRFLLLESSVERSKDNAG